jgi:hypothetical protein
MLQYSMVRLCWASHASCAVMTSKAMHCNLAHKCRASAMSVQSKCSDRVNRLTIPPTLALTFCASCCAAGDLAASLPAAPERSGLQGRLSTRTCSVQSLASIARTASSSSWFKKGADGMAIKSMPASCASFFTVAAGWWRCQCDQYALNGMASERLEASQSSSTLLSAETAYHISQLLAALEAQAWDVPASTRYRQV